MISLSTIDWKEKLSSRKLWIGAALVVIGIVLCVTGDVKNGMTLISIGGVGYLGAETVVDIARAIFPNDVVIEPDLTVETEPEDENEDAE